MSIVNIKQFRINQSGLGKVGHTNPIIYSISQHAMETQMAHEMPEVDVFEVELVKDNSGLGITIAGYVGDSNRQEGESHSQ